MKNKIKISENYRSIWVYLVLGIVSLWYLAGLTKQILSGVPASILGLLVSGALIAGVCWYILRLKMKIKVGRKSLKVKSNQWWGQRAKIKWREIANMEPFHIPEALMWTGYSISFDRDVDQFRMGDNKGVKVELKSGKTVLIYSADLHRKYDELKMRWKSHRS